MRKQVTPEQLEVWLADPVTQAYLDCVEYLKQQVDTLLSGGTFIDPTNTSLTQYNAASLHARKNALVEMGNPLVFLGNYEKPEVENAA